MPQSQIDPGVHKVKIQQMYWVKDTSEERMQQVGAVCLAMEVNQIECYDTDTYHLAMNWTWLSKSNGQWRLIVDQSGNETADVKQNGSNVKHRDNKTGKNNNNALKYVGDHQKPSKNNDDSRKDLACYELVDEREIIENLSRIVNTAHGTNNMAALDDFVERHGIQRYTSFQNTKRATYKLRDGFTAVLTLDEASSRKVAVIYLDVEIENVSRGFQRMEDLAMELDLQPQTKCSAV
ncbi:hypothetical protein GDO86_014826 [Hymenochirus boettgeri]|uniref:Uncharacterized protein n=1 Tax=Hymenochirus boettgeri TaxID=247094 RepID=A0A8T2JW31_9PIPI|nr:hypothetical protein GDO86_014826 [Hymenochirus boettgeri]